MQNFTELYEVERRYEELAHKMSTPDAAANADEYARMMRDYKELTPLIEEYRRYTDLQQQEKDAKEMLAAESDPAFAAMVQQELCEIARNLAQSEENLRLLLIPKDADDEKSVILEIRAGAGGEEAALFAHSLWRMYTMYAARRGWQCETISANETELGGVKEIVFSVEGPDVYSRLKFESGVHRVQRVPETETQGRIHTSTVTVAVMPEAEEVELEINPKDLRIDTFRSSGAGGQHINKTSSAIRVTHLHGGRMPGPAQPAGEQGPRLESPAQPPFTAKAGCLRRGVQRPPPKPGGQRRPQRKDTHLQLPAGPCDRPPHWFNAAQPARRAGRRPGPRGRAADSGRPGRKAETKQHRRRKVI